ncbi:MAG: reverse transcriptase family protein [Paramuribaculum sp.]|nr:reverse transcriptase family protein [Paramuribaculum sp.]
MREHIADSFIFTPIKCRQDFLKVLNGIAPLIDSWSIAQPLSYRALMRFATAKARAESYITFDIPKKSGGARSISAPTGKLKAIQSAINVLMQSLFTPNACVTGFTRGKNVRDNAKIHLGQSCIFNIDIEKFFPSITKSMLRKALHREFGEIFQSSEVINTICSLCTVPGMDGKEVLPQGAPTSPVLSNIVLQPLDRELVQLSKQYGLRYSRYADDITFSHNHPVRRITPKCHAKIRETIKRYGLKINDCKTSTLVPGMRQEVTGVVVSSKLNVPRSFIKQLRSLLHLWAHYGYERAQQIYTCDFCQGTEKSLARVIRGKINYLAMIKGKDDSTYLRYRQILRSLSHS